MFYIIIRTKMNYSLAFYKSINQFLYTRLYVEYQLLSHFD